MVTMAIFMKLARLPRAGRLALAIVALAGLLAVPVMADSGYEPGHFTGSNSGQYSINGSSRSYGSTSRSYSSGSYSRSYSSGSSRSYTTPTRTVTTSAPSGRRYHYSVGYRDGNRGFGWLGYRSGVNTNSGYSGANTSIATPHRASWNAKINAQRRWDQQQAQQGGKGAACGYTTSPAYCYKLMGPYPTEMKIVRY